MSECENLKRNNVIATAPKTLFICLCWLLVAEYDDSGAEARGQALYVDFFLLNLAIKRPQTRSTAAREVSNTHERDLVTNQNVYFRPFLGQTYLLESLFFDPVREQLGISASGDWRNLCRVKKH